MPYGMVGRERVKRHNFLQFYFSNLLLLLLLTGHHVEHNPTMQAQCVTHLPELRHT